MEALTDQYPFILREAARAYLAEDLEAGRLALDPIKGEIWSGLTSSARPRPARTPQPKPSVGRRSFNPKHSATTFLRDEFRCRYCDGEIIPKPIAVLLHELYPQELPFHPHYKTGCMHPLFWTRVAEADHLVAGSVGGDWTALDNLVTACVQCNTKKNNYSIEEMGWSLKTPTVGWDGLTSLYPLLWEKAGQPNPKFHSPWLQVFGARSC